MPDADRPLPCIVCGMQPESVDPHDGHRLTPSEATMFDSHGHYGSTVWDPMGGSRYLLINVCDECLVANHVRVAVVETIRHPPRWEVTPWSPPSGDDDV